MTTAPTTATVRDGNPTGSAFNRLRYLDGVDFVYAQRQQFDRDAGRWVGWFIELGGVEFVADTSPDLFDFARRWRREHAARFEVGDAVLWQGRPCVVRRRRFDLPTPSAIDRGEWLYLVTNSDRIIRERDLTDAP